MKYTHLASNDNDDYELFTIISSYQAKTIKK